MWRMVTRLGTNVLSHNILGHFHRKIRTENLNFTDLHELVIKTLSRKICTLRYTRPSLVRYKQIDWINKYAKLPKHYQISIMNFKPSISM
jgi:hypothetical protein